MSTEISLVSVQKQIGHLGQSRITEETVEDVRRIAEDPEYGEEFIDYYMNYLNVLKDYPSQTHTQYVNALKFFTLTESGCNLTDSYAKVFPERLAEREKKNPGEGYERIRTEASRYNKTKLVNELRRISAIPVSLIHRHLMHEAILEQAELMRTAKSEFVRQKAGEVLIRELKPAEDTQINVKVDDGSKSVIAELHKAAEELAIRERRSVQAGVPLKEIAQYKIIEGEAEEVEEND